MIQSLSVEVLVERQFRETTSRSVCDYYWESTSAASVNHHVGLSTKRQSYIMDLDSFVGRGAS